MSEGTAMDTIQIMVIIAGAFFLIFLFGFWLRRSGKPYHVVIFNLHKLIALAVLVFLAFTVYRQYQNTALILMESAAAAITGLLFVATIIAGGLISIDKPMPSAIKMIHKLFPFLTVLSAFFALYLLLIK